MRHFQVIILAIIAIQIDAAAQPVTTVTANPAAVTLRVYWGLDGSSGFRVGTVGSLPDIDGDGRDELILTRDNPYGWQLFHGDSLRPRPDTTWFFSGKVASTVPVVGNFYGGGKRYVALYGHWLQGPRSWDRFDLYLFALDSGRIADTARAMWDSWPGTDPLVLLSDVAAADLDGDGDDELILFSATAYHDGGWRDNGEIWIYEGGPNFTLDTPTVVLINPQPHSRSNTADLEVADVDGDGHPDLLTRVETITEAGRSP